MIESATAGGKIITNHALTHESKIQHILGLYCISGGWKGHYRQLRASNGGPPSGYRPTNNHFARFPNHRQLSHPSAHENQQPASLIQCPQATPNTLSPWEPTTGGASAPTNRRVRSTRQTCTHFNDFYYFCL